jgi:hypothetical protein
MSWVAKPHVECREQPLALGSFLVIVVSGALTLACAESSQFCGMWIVAVPLRRCSRRVAATRCAGKSQF